MGTKDRAVDYTLEFLRILEVFLHIEGAPSGRPVFVNDGRVNNFSIARLRDALREHSSGSSRLNAIVDLESASRPESSPDTYGNGGTPLIQTTGVGFAAELDTFVKLGLLLGDRLVLWDAMVLSLLKEQDDRVDLDALGSVACGMLSLREIANAGDLLILPHPLVWLDRAQHYFAALARAVPGGNSALQGYVNARALIDEGIRVHPYSTDDGRSDVSDLRKALFTGNDLFNEQKADYQEKVLAFVQDERFVFRKDLSAAEFHKALTAGTPIDGALQDELRKSLSGSPDGLSVAERQKHFTKTMADLARVVANHNRRMLTQLTFTGGAVAGVVSAIISLVGNRAAEVGLMALIGGGLMVASRNLAAIEKVLGFPSKPVLYQVFSRMKAGAEQEELSAIADKHRLLTSDEPEQAQ